MTYSYRLGSKTNSKSDSQRVQFKYILTINTDSYVMFDIFNFVGIALTFFIKRSNANRTQCGLYQTLLDFNRIFMHQN